MAVVIVVTVVAVASHRDDNSDSSYSIGSSCISNIGDNSVTCSDNSYISHGRSKKPMKAIFCCFFTHGPWRWNRQSSDGLFLLLLLLLLLLLPDLLLLCLLLFLLLHTSNICLNDQAY